MFPCVVYGGGSWAGANGSRILPFLCRERNNKKRKSAIRFVGTTVGRLIFLCCWLRVTLLVSAIVADADAAADDVEDDEVVAACELATLPTAMLIN